MTHAEMHERNIAIIAALAAGESAEALAGQYKLGLAYLRRLGGIVETPGRKPSVKIAARNRQIMEAFIAGEPMRDLANRFGLNHSTVCMILRGTPRPVKTPNTRATRMIEMYRLGLTLEQVGQQYGVTREYVRQTLRRWGVAREEGGGRVRKAVSAMSRAEQRERVYIARWGCGVAEHKLIVAARGTVGWREHRRNTRNRGLVWNLNLKQWWDIWQQSGHWHERGRRATEYCMARLLDRGGYTLGNVYITTCRENGQAYQQHRDKSRARSATPGIYDAFPGLKRRFVAKFGKVFIGRYESKDEAIIARQSFLEKREQQAA